MPRLGKKFAFQIAVSLVGIFWVFYSLQDLDWEITLASLTDISMVKLSTCFLFVILIYTTRMIRLRYFVEQISCSKLTFTEWTDLYLKSLAFGSITPARLGDFSRITLLAKTGLDILIRSKITILDKLEDVGYIPIGICLTSGVVGRKLNISVFWLFTWGAVSFIAYLAATYWFGRFLGLKVLVTGVVITLLGFCLYVTGNTFLFWAVGVELSILDITAIILSVGVLVSLPISIGGIGVREGSLIHLLLLWGVSSTKIPPILLFEFVLNIILPIALYLLWLLFLLIKTDRGCNKNGVKISG